jgi:hypothetical protein
MFMIMAQIAAQLKSCRHERFSGRSSGTGKENDTKIVCLTTSLTCVRLWILIVASHCVLVLFRKDINYNDVGL